MDQELRARLDRLEAAIGEIETFLNDERSAGRHQPYQFGATRMFRLGEGRVTGTPEYTPASEIHHPSR